MLAAVDVHYAEDGSARAAIVVFEAWTSASARFEHVVPVAETAPYEPGAFYKRELPCILAALEAVPSQVHPEVVVVDGHAWLGEGKPGLGCRLYEARPDLRAVVGVAKTKFAGATAEAVKRGTSDTPLWVDEVGARSDASAGVRAMHGDHRVPTLLRRVDQLCRGRA